MRGCTRWFRLEDLATGDLLLPPPDLPELDLPALDLLDDDLLEELLDLRLRPLLRPRCLRDLEVLPPLTMIITKSRNRNPNTALPPNAM